MPSNLNKVKPSDFKYRISTSLVLGLILLVVVIAASSYLIIWLEGKPQLAAMHRDVQTRLGQNISLALERDLQEAKGVTRAIARAYTAIPPEQAETTLALMVPAMLEVGGAKSIYAGGGVWPEPYSIDPNIARRSFFWAKEAGGNLIYLDDYNDPAGPGYHNEEWYVGAKVLAGNGVYWSKSYTDPYSLQPMVTCSVPIYDGEKFKGVSTVDLKLEGVSKVLNNLLRGIDGYTFLIDSNNKFIVFPTLGFDLSSTKPQKSASGFLTLDDLAAVYPSFKFIVNRISLVNQKLFEKLADEKPKWLEKINSLDEGSYQINTAEAKRLVANSLYGESKLNIYPKPVDSFDIDNDVLLGGDAAAYIYQMPSTNWRIVTVFDKRTYGEMTDLVTRKLFGSFLFSSIFFGLIAYFFIHHKILVRITRFVDYLKYSWNSSDDTSNFLKNQEKDEFGLLAFWFNKRSQHLEDKLDKAERVIKSKSDFLAGMACELKTPIKSIIGFNRKLLVKLGSELDAKNYQSLISVQRTSHHLLTLIEDLFEVSQLEAGKVKLNLDWYSVNKVLADAVSQMSGQISDADLNLSVHTLDKDIEFEVDEHKVVHVLIHILANAINSMDKGDIIITAQLDKLGDEKAVSFSVQDSGRGVSDDEKLLILKQFTRSEEYAGIEKGIGLGLFLVREIVALHRGAIFFDSTLGKGSTFRIVIPIQAKT